ncbi:MAG: ATP-binding protein [Acidobacteria bacterium]|jgi:serine/threonine-protein kinase RsbW|nr:ATP-binding protein [Acidobacteriota bacterium]
MTGSTDTLFASNLASVDAAEAMVVESAADLGFDEDARMDLGLAIREAMVNAVAHGNAYSPDKQVRLLLAVGTGSIRVTIIDQGEGFDLNQVPDPTRGENLLRESGRGLLLMQAFVDEFSVKRSAQGGAEVVLVKYASETGR